MSIRNRPLMVIKATLIVVLRTLLLPLIILISFIRLRRYRKYCKTSNIEQNERFDRKFHFPLG